MLKQIRRTIATLRRLGKNDAGSVMPMFVLTLIPLLGLIGATTDYTRVTKVRASLQASLDVALLAGARDGSTNWSNVALDTFNANVQAGDATLAAPAFAIDGNRAYTGTASASVPTLFGSVLGLSSVNVNVQGTATAKTTSGNYYCVMALNPTAQAALQLTGNASITITAPKCVLL
jgi:Flp pilus assembly protein TadG